MPTGVHLHDARRHLFDAAERVLRSAGPEALTSRAVTVEAGVAKGVLHRHFADFDAFLVALVADRAARVEAQAAALRTTAGTGAVVDAVTAALTELFDPVATAVVALVVSRAALRATPGIPVLTEATAMIADYLTEERALGRIAADADPAALALALVGGAHLLFADRSGPPDAAAVRRVADAALADVVQRRLL